MSPAAMAFQASFAQTILVFLSPVFIVITPIVFLFVSSKLCLAMMAALGCQEVGSVWAFTLFTLLGMLSFVVFNVLANLGAKPKTLINEFYLDYACDCDKTWRIESYYNLERPCPRCQKNVKSFSRTPYHGQERVFGRFKCSTCGRQWFSHASWANMSQNCLNCQSQVFPYQQKPWEKMPDKPTTATNDTNYKPQIHHQINSCEQCQSLGADCTRVWASKRFEVKH